VGQLFELWDSSKKSLMWILRALVGVGLAIGWSVGEFCVLNRTHFSELVGLTLHGL